MNRLPERSNGVIRPDWLMAAAREVQIASGRASVIADITEARAIFEQFIRSLPDAKRPLEHLILNSLLLHCAFRSGEALHTSIHGKKMPRCGFAPAALVERAWSGGNTNGRQAFAGWVRLFCTELSRTHPTPISRQVARIVRDRFAESFGLAMLARRLHATPSRLREEFRAEYGMSIREYQQHVRTMRGLDRIAFDKVEAVAYAVGYRSKKNFYRAFQKVTGLTLDAYRRLSPEGSAKVRESVARRVQAQ